ncbi:unnamed protein product [Plutella xylostella]|uniref:(diamondback moth) hypothetical protein n=1 Tax=Plutella xylostella TaxID=51655 RepID=A0A8S4EUX1_PLUXY|nr:unnamed protein product [Plutella xylostella]
MKVYCGYISINPITVCRACLQACGSLNSATNTELEALRNIVGEGLHNEVNIKVCLYCSSLLRKLARFTRVCRQANYLLQKSANQVFPDTIPPFHTFTASETHTVQYPEYSDNDQSNLKVESGDDGPAVDDHDDDVDDEDTPLSMLSKDATEIEPQIDEPKEASLEIKQEPSGLDFDAKIQEKDKKHTKRKQKKKTKNVKTVREDKKELREGFSSRMVQETNEYRVIKLTKEQILAELQTKRDSPAYTRAPLHCAPCARAFNHEDVRRNHMEKHSEVGMRIMTSDLEGAFNHEDVRRNHMEKHSEVGLKIITS